jgi:hypothetical protein
LERSEETRAVATLDGHVLTSAGMNSLCEWDLRMENVPVHREMRNDVTGILLTKHLQVANTFLLELIPEL